MIDVPADYSPRSMSFAFPIDSPYLGPFNHILQQLRERGSMEKIKNKYNPKPQVRFRKQ